MNDVTAQQSASKVVESQTKENQTRLAWVAPAISESAVNEITQHGSSSSTWDGASYS